MARVLRKATPLPKLLKKTQEVFNRWIRERDRDKGCISRGCNGAVEHAGHYFNQGSHSALRYDPANVHGSCIKCNLFLSGNLIRYRQGLIDRYGEDYVRNLEDREARFIGPYKWHRIELEEIIKKYK